LRDRLEEHLATLKRLGVIAGWHDRKIGAGREWEGEISEHLDSAHIILLLISPSFLASDYCHDVELKRAMERHDRGEARVIPVILRPVDWRGAEFGKLQALPRNGVAVTAWGNRDRAFADVARGIREVLAEVPDIVRSPIQRLIRDLERAWVDGNLQGSVLAPDVLVLLRDEWDLKLAESYNPDDMIAGILASDDIYKPIVRSAGQRDWRLDAPKAAVSIMVGMAWSFERSADAQAVVLRWCDVIAKRFRQPVFWPADPGEANDLRDAIYLACFEAKVLQCDRVLELLQRLFGTGPG
jgi:hypothetical protein